MQAGSGGGATPPAGAIWNAHASPTIIVTRADSRLIFIILLLGLKDLPFGERLLVWRPAYKLP